jgi:hypothetical protein
MFLKVFYGDDIKVYRDIDSTFFRTRSEDGLMSLQFDISPDHELYRYFALSMTDSVISSTALTSVKR